MAPATDEANEVIHQSTRLRIRAALNVLEPGKWLEFTRLRALVQATDGNLGAHLETLAQAGYIAADKLFVGKKPQTRVRATGAGRAKPSPPMSPLRALLEEPIPDGSESSARNPQHWSDIDGC